MRQDTDAIFDWEKATADDWILRKVDVRITELGLELGVKTHIVNPPLICTDLSRSAAFIS